MKRLNTSVSCRLREDGERQTEAAGKGTGNARERITGAEDEVERERYDGDHQVDCEGNEE